MGVVLLAAVLAWGYRTVFAAWRRHTPLGDLTLAYFFVGLVFNFTEAAFFKSVAPVWIFFLFAITKVPGVPYRKIGPPVRELFQRPNPAAWQQPQPTLTGTSNAAK
jgi:hypothetical protein